MSNFALMKALTAGRSFNATAVKKPFGSTSYPLSFKNRFAASGEASGL
jgi:hypothetical protein